MKKFILLLLLFVSLDFSASLFFSQVSTQKFYSSQVQSVLEDIIDIHDTNGGSTYHFYKGNLAGNAMYAVSIFPDLGVVLSGKNIQMDILEDFIYKNIFLLQDSRCCVGTWFDEKSRQTYIDITVVLASRDKAIELGKRYNQIAIWDLQNFVEIATGGDGKSVSDLPPPRKRLSE